MTNLDSDFRQGVLEELQRMEHLVTLRFDRIDSQRVRLLRRYVFWLQLHLQARR
jgi:c-di-GMP-binding flagellar brake protein YcgR